MGLLGNYLPNWLPEDQDKREAAKMGLLNFGAAMLANANQGFAPALGGGLLAGSGTYQDTLQTQRVNRFQDMKLSQMQSQMNDEQKVRDFYGNINQFMPSQASQAMAANAKAGRVGPTGAFEPEQMTQPAFDAGAMYQAMLRSGSPTLAQAGLQGLSKPQDEAVVVGEGGALVSKTTGKPLYSNPKQDKPLELERMIRAAGITDPNEIARIMQNAITKQTTHAPSSQVNNFLGTKETFKNERDLRNDFQGLPTTKAFREVQSAYDQINFALKNPSAANDLAAATKFMKLLDPGSVVRESELAMAMSATGLMDRVSNYASMLQQGHKLTPKQREDFYKAAEGLYGAASGRYNEAAGEYRSVANDYGLNADRIAKPAQTPQRAPQAQAQPAAMPSMSDIDAELARRRGK